MYFNRKILRSLQYQYEYWTMKSTENTKQLEKNLRTIFFFTMPFKVFLRLIIISDACLAFLLQRKLKVFLYSLVENNRSLRRENFPISTSIPFEKFPLVHLALAFKSNHVDEFVVDKQCWQFKWMEKYKINSKKIVINSENNRLFLITAPSQLNRIARFISCTRMENTRMSWSCSIRVIMARHGTSN